TGSTMAIGARGSRSLIFALFTLLACYGAACYDVELCFWTSAFLACIWAITRPPAYPRLGLPGLLPFVNLVSAREPGLTLIRVLAGPLLLGLFIHSRKIIGAVRHIPAHVWIWGIGLLTVHIFSAIANDFPDASATQIIIQLVRILLVVS